MLSSARRALWASGASSAACRRRASVWPPLTRPLGRWLSTASSGTASDGRHDDDFHSRDQAKAAQADRSRPRETTTRETAAQKNAREFALLPRLLRVFEESTGHRIVPFHFVIPSQDDSSVAAKWTLKCSPVTGRVSDASEIPWPDEARGMNLGRVLMKFVTNPKHYTQFPRVAEELGFPLGDAYRESRWREETMAPLKVYYEIHKHCLVPQDFVVPRGDPLWPVSSWGYNLGTRVNNLRSRQELLDSYQLDDLVGVDFSFDVDESMWSDCILPALETYEQVHTNCRIPPNFHVPRTDPWPRKAWGFALRTSVSNIRLNGAYASQVERDRPRLEAIGFVWDYFEHMWSEIILLSLEMFYRLEGHTCVPRSFEAPSEEPWPREAWGHPLGQTVSRIRSKGTYATQAARDADRLEAIDFV